MNKNLKSFAVIAAAFAIGVSVNNSALSDSLGKYKVAVVDIQQVVASSSQVNDLKKENQAKAEEIMSFIEKARKDVAATKDADKKKSLEEKYTKELNKKREAYGSVYNAKMQEIQINILNAVREQANANGYDLVIAKDVVLYGGEDITAPLKSSVSAIKNTKKKK
jgi:Skp family chaperone for outer membrane proteins